MLVLKITAVLFIAFTGSIWWLWRWIKKNNPYI
jgi:cbb3-type cytochrome oxidase subunit 3